jgi:N-acetylneuraminic acid mutarotase
MAVFATAAVGTDLYVGGGFTGSRDGALTDLNHIARYDTTAAAWHSLPNGGLSDDARALALIGSDLYVGGLFTETVDGSLTDLGRVARYDTAAGTWHALPKEGLSGPVWALAAVGTDLYVGGFFTGTVDGSLTNLGNIARYDTVGGTWEVLPKDGLYGQVFVLEVAGSDLYVGGNFNWFGDMSAIVGCVARYDTTVNTWSTLPNQVGNGVNAGVYGLEVVGTDVYAGGYFTQSGDGLTDLGHVARYDTVAGTWHNLPNQGLDAAAEAFETVGSDLYVGGLFTETLDGTIPLGYIARYDTVGGAWHALPNEGLSTWVLTFATMGDDLYLGGYFSASGDWQSRALGRIARYGICYPIYVPLVPRNVVLGASAAGRPGAMEER